MESVKSSSGHGALLEQETFKLSILSVRRSRISNLFKTPTFEYKCCSADPFVSSRLVLPRFQLPLG